jgi:hypothetical protein
MGKYRTTNVEYLSNIICNKNKGRILLLANLVTFTLYNNITISNNFPNFFTGIRQKTEIPML